MAAYEYVKPPFFLPLSKKPPHEPILASRLADFTTGRAEPHPSHKDWLRGEVARLLNSKSGSWVDLIGHASAVGDAGANMELSKRRVQQVEAAIRSAAPDCERYKEFPKGEQESGIVQSDNSPCFRSVEVIVYAQSTPKPAPLPIVFTEPRLVYRETLEQQQNVQQGAIGDDPIGGLLPGMGRSSVRVHQRLLQHPCEVSDADFGNVTKTTSGEINGDFVMVSAVVEKVWQYYVTTYNLVENRTNVDITRRYTFTYGPGNLDQKVIVNRRETVRRPTGRVESVITEIFHVDQPPSYVDP